MTFLLSPRPQTQDEASGRKIIAGRRGRVGGEGGRQGGGRKWEEIERDEEEDRVEAAEEEEVVEEEREKKAAVKDGGRSLRVRTKESVVDGD